MKSCSEVRLKLSATWLRAAVAAGLALLLAACASHTPVHYFTLVGTAPTAPGVAPAAYDINVLPVKVPRALRRRAMVLRTGDARLMVQDGHQWAAPLPDEFRAALAADLVARLGTRDVSGLGDTDRPVYRVALVVQRFDAVYDQHVVLEALWSLSDTSGKTLLTCTSTSTRKVGNGYTALARGGQQALAGVAGQIAAALKALPQTTCPVRTGAPSTRSSTVAN